MAAKIPIFISFGLDLGQNIEKNNNNNKEKTKTKNNNKQTNKRQKKKKTERQRHNNYKQKNNKQNLFWKEFSGTIIFGSLWNNIYIHSLK